jgi:hypothetical protein
MDSSPKYIQIENTASKSVFIRSDYPALHLTISWKTPSGIMNVHLTRHLSDGSKIHSYIARFTEADLIDYLNTIGQELAQKTLPFIPKLMPIRPGWLGRRGYLILWISEETNKQLIDRFAQRHKKKKYRIYSTSFTEMNHLEEFMKYIYEPSILHKIADYSKPGLVQAVPLIGRRKKKRRFFTLKYMPWLDSKLRWVAIDHALGPAISKEIEDSFLQKSFFKSLPDNLNKVFNELRLEELGINRNEFTSFML